MIEGAGIALAKPDNAQLLAAVVKLASRVVPVGGVVFGYFNAAEPGFILRLQ